MSEGAAENAPDFYVQQLHEIFQSCDSSGSGFLGRDDLLHLCAQLNLDSDVSRQIIDLLHIQSSTDCTVSFDQFKGAFVSVLTEHDDDDDGDHSREPKTSGGLENAVDMSEEERHVHAIFAELGIGANGHVTKEELHRICQYLKMDEMTDKELDQLFKKLDVNGDGLLNFNELFHGLFETDEAVRPETLKMERPKTSRRMLSLPLDPSFGHPSRTPHFDQPVQGWEGIYAFLDRDGLGYADSDSIIRLWESFGITEGHLIIKLLRFHEKKPISLRDLSMALINEIHCFEVDTCSNILYQTALITMEHALDYLHSTNEELKHERDRISDELAQTRNRNASLVTDFDDAYTSAEVDNLQKQRVAEQRNRIKYQDLLDELNRETDSSSELQRQVNALKEEVKFLNNKIKEADKPTSDSVSDNIKRDQWTEEQYETELQKLMRGISIERKDIEGAFRIEIADLEQRHQSEINAIKDQFKQEKDELAASHKRLLESALAERERDLLTEFSKEIVSQSIDADRKDLQERLEAAEENARLKTVYADDLEKMLMELQRQEEAGKSLVHETTKEEEEELKRSERLLRERFEEEKRKILNDFEQEITRIKEEHRKELLRYELTLSQRLDDERKIIEASASDRVLELERELEFLKDENQQRERENELIKKDFEKQMFQKEAEKELFKKELEQELHKTVAELQLVRKQAEQALSEKHAELERNKMERKVEAENERRKKETERKASLQSFRDSLPEMKVEKRNQEVPVQSFDDGLPEMKAEKRNQEVPVQSFDDGLPEIKAEKRNREVQVDDGLLLSRLLDRTSDRDTLLRLQIDELCRNNVRLKDELERELLDSSIVAERDLLKRQLQLTVNQLSEATSALSLMSQELNQEKEAWRRKLNQMVDRKRYDDLAVRLRHVEAKSHRLQHDFDFKVAETTKLLNVSKIVTKQRLDQMTEENTKLASQVKSQKTLISDQLAKILKQTDELVKSDLLIHDLYVENAHLLKCLQKTEGHRQDSDQKVQTLEEKCLTLGRLFHSVGTAAIRY